MSNIIDYMLKNSYVRIGIDYIALQIRGLPQGAPPSPPLARLVCIKREWEWNMLFGPEQLLKGMRFMDDVYMLFFYNNKDNKTKKRAENLKEDFKTNCYYPQWN